MKCFVLTLRDEESSKRFNRLKQSLVQFGWKDHQIVPVYGRRGEDYHDLAAEFDVPTLPFYDSQPERKEEFNKAFSCTIGHVEIWKNIAYGHCGRAIVCEDDVVFKADPSCIADYSNTKINWLGPRIWNECDYNIPHNDFRFIEVERFEGTHAYVISEGTAQRLYKMFKQHGFDDSLDGQLGMRRIFPIEHQLLNPPIAVAIVGDQVSSITNEGAAFWNADNFPGLLDGLHPEAKIPPERKIHRLDSNWQTERASVLAEIEICQSAIFLGCGDGDFIREIVDAAGSRCRAMIYDRQFDPVVNNNLYFCHYYYNLAAIQASPLAAISALAVGLDSIDLIVISNPKDADTAVQMMALGWLTLSPGGKMVVRGTDKSFNNVLSGVNAKCLLNLPTTQIYQK